jgi:hypothetical protein
LELPRDVSLPYTHLNNSQPTPPLNQMSLIHKQLMIGQRFMQPRKSDVLISDRRS